MKFSFLIETPVISSARLAAVVVLMHRAHCFPAVYAITLLGQQRDRSSFSLRERNSRERVASAGTNRLQFQARWRKFLGRNKRIAGTLRYVRAWTSKFLATSRLVLLARLLSLRPAESVIQPDFSHTNIFCFVRICAWHQKADAIFVV